MEQNNNYCQFRVKIKLKLIFSENHKLLSKLTIIHESIRYQKHPLYMFLTKIMKMKVALICNLNKD